MAERRILVVDDDKMIHTVVRAAIEKHGYRVFSAFDTMQAPMMARQVKPDLIVLDINMPGGGGFEAFRRLQMMSWTVQVPVLVYSALTYAEISQHIPASPQVAYLAKPAPPEDILAAVCSLLPQT